MESELERLMHYSAMLATVTEPDAVLRTTAGVMIALYNILDRHPEQIVRYRNNFLEHVQRAKEKITACDETKLCVEQRDVIGRFKDEFKIFEERCTLKGSKCLASKTSAVKRPTSQDRESKRRAPHSVAL